jgi:signal transduction histidine kinase
VLFGFADNALKHSKRGDRVELRARRSGASAVLEVADRGPGVAEDDVARIFDRFFRVDESHGSRGAGLGLAIAKEIAEAHGTSVSVTATPGGGATFGLELPIAE